MIEFTSFQHHSRGLLVSLLAQSYAGYFQYDPECKAAWQKDWEEYDRDVFQYPDTVGASGFVTCLEGRAIGFASWDPRQLPDIGIIGHNCILPDFRGNSYGIGQIVRVLGILREQGCLKACVTTGEHSFFKPAQQMYQSCGFTEVQRSYADVNSKFRTIDYELSLL
ncbi:MAG: GNAT family N-acetyltransferase [Dehalococcoidales bacterium]|nr:MAG: GNAT family N-acetyltransferase [Dehalococcoidales bacterium]